MLSKRLEYIDQIKGAAIFLVVWGHTIQYLSGNEYSFGQNPVFKFIYSFHMPLFYTISGFFLASCLTRNAKDVVKKKFKQLIIPTIFWVILNYLIKVNVGLFNFPVDDIFNQILKPVNWQPWFLKELFLSIIISLAVFHIFRRNILLMMILSLFLIFWLPFFEFQRFLLPYFFVGFVLSKAKTDDTKWDFFIFGVSLLIFILSYSFWSFDLSVYYYKPKTIFNLANLQFTWTDMDLYIYLVRFIVGLSGTLFFFYLFKILFTRFKPIVFFSKLGTKTLSIYLIQSLVLEIILARFVNLSGFNEITYSFLITPVISILIIYSCLYISHVLSKNTTLSKII